MPLPFGGHTPWPPAHLAPAFDQMNVYAAWWEGDPEKLSAVYGGATDTSPTAERSFERPSRYRGGVVGAVARWFWGQPTPPQQQRAKVHVPLASDMAATSADLLFSRSITVTFGHPPEQPPGPAGSLPAAAAAGGGAGATTAPGDGPNPAQLRFDHLREISGFDSTLLEAAEVAAALSGVYLRLCWDADVQDGPFLDVVHPDSAVPEFRYGRLWAVTFWRELGSTDDRRNGRVLRHLERHERGRILHGLYEGDRDSLGRPVPLTGAPDLQGLAEQLIDGNEITTVEGRLTAVYVPNIRPNPAWRHNPQLAPLGRSDFTPGVLSLMDRLDEVMSSWMRDIRIGLGRIMIPEQYVENLGRGKGAAFDLSREVFTTLNMLPTPGGPPQITASQFQIRVDEHERTCRWLMDQIARAAGYSAQTFGSNGEGTAATATEINARERRSVLTREKKTRYWDNALTELIFTWLRLDAALGSSGGAGPRPAGAPEPVEPERPPAVEFPAIADADLLRVAQTAQAISGAAAASKYTLVKLLHPEWDDAQLQKELDRIAADAQDKDAQSEDAPQGPDGPDGPATAIAVAGAGGADVPATPTGSAAPTGPETRPELGDSGPAGQVPRPDAEATWNGPTRGGGSPFDRTGPAW